MAIQQKHVRFIILSVLCIWLHKPAFPMSEEPEVWTNLGLYGGQVLDIAIDPQNPQKMFASTYMGDGLFVSEDGGNHWDAVETESIYEEEDSFKNQKVYRVEIAENDSDTIWVAHNYWVGRSEDGGKNWSHIRNYIMQRDCSNCGGEGDNFRLCLSLAIDPSDAQIIFAGTAGPLGSFTSGAIYKTSDAGQSWIKAAGLPFPVVDIDIDPNDSNIIWAVTSSHGYGEWNGSLYRSGDGGNNWEEIISLAPFGTTFSVVEIKPDDSQTVFTGGGFGLMKHFYNGEQWLYQWPVIEGAQLATDIVFAPNDPEKILVAWKNYWGDAIPKLSVSRNGGDTWVTHALDHNLFFEILSLSVHPSDSNTVFTGDSSLGIVKTQDLGQTWLPINEGINAIMVYDVTNDMNDPKHLLAGTISGIYEKRGGTDWKRISPLTSRSVRFHPQDSDTFYAGSEKYVVKSSDGGLTWTYSNPLSEESSKAKWIEINRDNPEIIYIAASFYGVGGKIYKSENGGGSFEEILSGVNTSGEAYDFNAVVIDPMNSQHIFAGGGNFYTPKVNGDLWESLDGGVTWLRTSLTDVIVNSILIDPGDPDTIYVGCGYSSGTDIPVYKSMDGGTTWDSSSEGLPADQGGMISNAVMDMKFHKENKDIIYTSTFDTGIFISVNRGKNWLLLGRPDYSVFAISVSSLYAATQGGLLQCTGTGVVAGSVTDALTGLGIDQATVFNDFGLTTDSVSGEYMMVAPAGNWDITAIADGYKNTSALQTTVYGGDVTWVNHDMRRGVSDPTISNDEPRIISEDGGGYCFIQSLREKDSSALAVLLFITALSAVLFLLPNRKKHRVTRFSILLMTLVSVIAASTDSLNAGSIFQQVGVASSPNPVGSGARAVGIGGAFIGIADDATAASWNPAGLIQLEKPELSVVTAWNMREEEFSSDTHPEIGNTGEIKDASINYFSVAYPFTFHKNMVISLNYQRLYEFQREFDATFDHNSGGLNLVQSKHFRQDGNIGAVGIAGAVEITPQLSFGLTVNIWTDELIWDNGWNETYLEHGEGALSSVPVSTDVHIFDDYSSFRAVNFNIGLLWNINNAITLGAVLKTPYTASLHHDYQFEEIQTFHFQEPTAIVSRERIVEDVELDMPISYGIGIGWRFSDAFSMDLDVYRTHWSDYVLEDGSGNRYSPIDGRPEDESDVEDTTQVRLGGEFLFIRSDAVIPVRAGIFYDPEPSHGTVRDFYGFSMGSGIGWGKYIFDAAYQFRWGKDVDAGNLISGAEADIRQHTIMASLIIHF